MPLGRSAVETCISLMSESDGGVAESFRHKSVELCCLRLRVVANKDDAEAIWKRMTRLRDTAATVTRFAILQEEYANALLDMCTHVCADSRRWRIIGRIMCEVALYPAVIGNERLESKVKETSDKCRYSPSQGVAH